MLKRFRGSKSVRTHQSDTLLLLSSALRPLMSPIPLVTAWQGKEVVSGECSPLQLSSLEPFGRLETNVGIWHSKSYNWFSFWHIAGCCYHEYIPPSSWAEQLVLVDPAPRLPSTNKLKGRIVLLCLWLPRSWHNTFPALPLPPPPPLPTTTILHSARLRFPKHVTHLCFLHCGRQEGISPALASISCPSSLPLTHRMVQSIRSMEGSRGRRYSCWLVGFVWSFRFFYDSFTVQNSCMSWFSDLLVLKDDNFRLQNNGSLRLSCLQRACSHKEFNFFLN